MLVRPAGAQRSLLLATPITPSASSSPTALTPSFSATARSAASPPPPARYDSWGGFRGTFDPNRVISDKQSFRINGLYVRNAYGPAYRDNAISDDKSIDLTWGDKLGKNTTFPPRRNGAGSSA